jgi:hypothetical protein
MTAQVMDTRMGHSITIDMCGRCQAFWFDGYESLQLSPAATLRLFQIIGDASGAPRHPAAPVAPCPRCRMQMDEVEDRQRGTRFRYRRCPQKHGRFIAFFDFLREKNFITTLSEAQLAELRTRVQTVNCSNCGAPIDLAHASACAHCGSPLSMFDLAHAGEVIEQLRAASARTPAADPSLAFDLLRARRDAERAVAESRRDHAWFQGWDATGSVADNVMALARWLGSRT